MKTFFKEESVKVLRDQSFTFLKLDVGYLVALVGAITAIKLNHYEFLSLVSHFTFALKILAILSLLDVLINIFIFDDWVKAVTNSKARMSHSVLAWMTKIQLIFHFLFISGIVSASTGFFEGEYSVYSAIEARVMLQDALDVYILDNEVSPNSIEELKEKSKSAQLAASQLNAEKFKYTKIGNKGYEIVFSGTDNIFGTNDDDIASSSFRLRNAFEKLKE